MWVGTLVALTAAGLAAAAVWPARRRREWLALLLLVAAGLLVRGYAGADRYLHPWDERYHALVAQHLARHPLQPTLYEAPALPFDYRDWHGNHVWLHKQPLALWLVALSLRLFGADEIAVRVPSLVLSGFAIVFTYLIGRAWAGPGVGLLAAFFHAINGLLVELASGRVATDHVDTVFVVLVEAAVLLAFLGGARGGVRTALAVGAVVGLAALAKSPVSLVALLVWAPFLWTAKGAKAAAGSLALAVLAAAAVYLPWQGYIHRAFPLEAAWEDHYAWLHLTETLEGHAGGPLFHLFRMPRHFGELVFLPLAWFCSEAIRKRRDAGTSAVLVWWLVPYLFFSLVATKMPAYVMVSAPAVFLIAARFWRELKDRAETLPAWGQALAAVALALLVVLPARYGWEVLQNVALSDRRPAWADAYRRVEGRLPAGRTVLFNVERPIELMFYAPVTAYARLPAAGEIDAVRRAGFTVAVWDDGRLPAWLRDYAGVLLLPAAASVAPDAR